MTMEIKRLPVLATEISKTVNYMNPCIPKNCAKIRPHDIISSYLKTAYYSDKILKALHPKIWN